MWFLFAPDKPNNQSQLFYGFPALPWGPSNVVRIAVDAATRRIKDPNDRQTNVINPDDIQNCQEFIAEHVSGVDPTVPAYSLTCLMTNVFGLHSHSAQHFPSNLLTEIMADNMFVLDFVPEKYLKGGPKDSVVIFTAGWAMKFVPLLGIALKDMALHGSSEFARPEFSILRTDPKGKGIIIDDTTSDGIRSAMSFEGPAKGSSMRSVKSVVK
jgi:sarcosine oxidase / L-pipecolate oxidase